MEKLLNDIKRFGFKWNKTPQQLLEEASSGSRKESMEITKSDLLLIFKFIDFRTELNSRLASSMREENEKHFKLLTGE